MFPQLNVVVVLNVCGQSQSEDTEPDQQRQCHCTKTRYCKGRICTRWSNEWVHVNTLGSNRFSLFSCNRSFPCFSSRSTGVTPSENTDSGFHQTKEHIYQVGNAVLMKNKVKTMFMFMCLEDPFRTEWKKKYTLSYTNVSINLTHAFWGN